MLLSRRNFLRTLGTGAALGAVAPPSTASLALGAMFEPPRQSEPGGPIRLNSNENPYGPSEKARAVLQGDLPMANRYPYAQYDGLVNRIAAFHRVKPQQVLLGCGSSEILRVAAAGFLSPGQQALVASPTFEALEAYARSLGAETVQVPLNGEFAHDLDTMLARATAATGLVYICNPNNPTASLTPRKDLETFLTKLPASTYVLMDEAYHHFAGQSPVYTSFLERPVENERMIVTRTFSKVYGLAGMRLGYAVAAPKVIEQMRQFATWDSVNALVVRTAMAALDDVESVQSFIQRNADVRQEFFKQAATRQLKPIDSQANFIMMNAHRPAGEIIEHFRRHNILIGRRFPAMNTYVRVSLGRPEEMKAFWGVWDLMPQGTVKIGG
jgi:histidinol-phosphate aminotransferase